MKKVQIIHQASFTHCWIRQNHSRLNTSRAQTRAQPCNHTVNLLPAISDALEKADDNLLHANLHFAFSFSSTAQSINIEMIILEEPEDSSSVLTGEVQPPLLK